MSSVCVMSEEKKPIGQFDLPMLGDALRVFRLQLGMTQAELGVALRLGEPNSAGRLVRRWEARKNSPVSGPVTLALEALAATRPKSLIGSGEEGMSKDEVKLNDGSAQHMGGGVFVVFQECEGEVVTVIITPDDLEQMIDANKKRMSAG